MIGYHKENNRNNGSDTCYLQGEREKKKIVITGEEKKKGIKL